MIYFAVQWECQQRLFRGNDDSPECWLMRVISRKKRESECSKQRRKWSRTWRPRRAWIFFWKNLTFRARGGTCYQIRGLRMQDEGWRVEKLAGLNWPNSREESLQTRTLEKPVSGLWMLKKVKIKSYLDQLNDAKRMLCSPILRNSSTTWKRQQRQAPV